MVPTDTIYGLVASALLPSTVKRLFKLRRPPAQAGKTPNKPFIVLISDTKELASFGVYPTASQKNILKKIWPGEVSVIFPVFGKQFGYLHRGTNALAFRLPAKKSLRELLGKTGPLLAPSANLEGEKPAETVIEAKKYFGDKADFYVNAGKRLAGKPSTLVMFENDTLKVLRAGAVKIEI